METSLHVELLNYSPNPEAIIATAAKLCYSASDIVGLRTKQTKEKAVEFVNKLMEMGHESPLEHISFTFGIEGISRCCANQLVRHRLASNSQQSQRYVGEQSSKNGSGCFDYIIPDRIKQIGMSKRYEKMMLCIQRFYDELSKGLNDAGFFGEKNNEEARYVLPNAAETKIITTMNARELLHFFELRTCNRSQAEINLLAKRMYKLVYDIIPSLFKYAGPCCVKDKCKEGKMSCGKMLEVKREFNFMREAKSRE